MRLVSREPWMAEANCRRSHPDLFFPERGDFASSWAAKAICTDCPVRLQCLEYGIDEDYGIWGGLNLFERERYKRLRRLAAS